MLPPPPQLKLRSSARQRANLIHGTSVHGPWYMKGSMVHLEAFPDTKNASFQKFASAKASQLRAPARKFNTWSMVHRSMVHERVHPKTFPLPKPRCFKNSPQLKLRSFARQRANSIHGPWYIGTWYMTPWFTSSPSSPASPSLPSPSPVLLSPLSLPRSVPVSRVAAAEPAGP